MKNKDKIKKLDEIINDEERDDLDQKDDLTKENVKFIQNDNSIVERIDKKIITEDGRQLLI